MNVGVLTAQSTSVTHPYNPATDPNAAWVYKNGVVSDPGSTVMLQLNSFPPNNIVANCLNPGLIEFFPQLVPFDPYGCQNNANIWLFVPDNSGLGRRGRRQQFDGRRGRRQQFDGRRQQFDGRFGNPQLAVFDQPARVRRVPSGDSILLGRLANNSVLSEFRGARARFSSRESFPQLSVLDEIHSGPDAAIDRVMGGDDSVYDWFRGGGPSTRSVLNEFR